MQTGQFGDATDYHLFVVVTGPLGENDELLIVNFASIYAGISYDDACVVTPGEHPFIRHDSYIKYDKARIVASEKLQNGARANILIPKESTPEPLFNRICNGFRTSMYVSPRVRRFFEEDQAAAAG